MRDYEYLRSTLTWVGPEGVAVNRHLREGARDPAAPHARQTAVACEKLLQVPAASAHSLDVGPLAHPAEQ